MASLSEGLADEADRASRADLTAPPVQQKSLALVQGDTTPGGLSMARLAVPRQLAYDATANSNIRSPVRLRPLLGPSHKGLELLEANLSSRDKNRSSPLVPWPMRRRFMGVACPKCGNENLRLDPINRFRLGVPHLSELQQAVVVLSCRPCRSNFQFVIQGRNRPSFSHFLRVGNDGKAGPDGLRRGHISLWSDTIGRYASVDYGFVHSDEQGVLWPMHEARIQTGTAVDQYGDPDLMADFANEYLKQHWVLLQPGGLPRTLVEVMPSLLLLVTAAELALKAFILRSKGEQPRTHDPVELYGRLDPKHQAAIESRFGRCQLVAGLASIGADAPQIDHILGTYADIYGSKRGAYQEAKFYAEPTTMLPETSDLRGANLIKGNTPYPTFMPYLVEAIVGCYSHFSGVERLRRRGVQIHERGPGSAIHGHGDWALRPSSLGLAVIIVSQQQSKDSNHNDLPAFASFKSLHPTSLQADWAYGGSTLLFYDATGSQPPDGIASIEGIEYRVISEEQVRMHARDLDRLADRLEAIDAGDTPLGTLPPAR